jgi:hypothetical protein
MTEPKIAGPSAAQYFHDFEHDLLLDFSKTYGPKNPKRQKSWPIFNKNAGRKHKRRHKHKAGWNRPLKNTNAGYIWSLSPAAKVTPKLSDT